MVLAEAHELSHRLVDGSCRVCGSTEGYADGRCAVAERARQRRWRKTNATPAWRRSNGLKHKYGMTPEQYAELLAKQGGGCAICEQPPVGRQLDVDHDHSCCPGIRSCGACVRGLLCSPCNRAVGYFRDNPALLRQAITYLENP